MAGFEPGQIVIADWRDAVPKEPNKLRPAIVVEDPDLFGPAYPSVILVPLNEDRQMAIPDLSLVIEPTPENGCRKPCCAISHFVTATSRSRVTATSSRILPAQLQIIRHQIALAIGLELSALVSDEQPGALGVRR